jgi:hypothetical protein
MNDLQAILDRDPRQHTREDRDAIITMYRERRNQYNLNPGRAAKPVSEKKKEVMSLGDALKGSLNL